jgi:formylglycine-generating enzyme required for sulfatase activity
VVARNEVIGRDYPQSHRKIPSGNQITCMSGASYPTGSPMISMSALDLLFWILILTLAGVVYAVEDGLAMRHRGLVFATMMSVVASCSYIMLGLDHTPAFAVKVPQVSMPVFAKPAEQIVDEIETAKQRSAAAEKARLAALAAREPNIKGVFQDCEGCPAMVALTVMNYSMGSPASEPGRRDTEGPRSINLAKAFAIGRFEVTVGEFALFVAETRHAVNTPCSHAGAISKTASWKKPGFEQNARHPVTCITWYDAKAYVNWLSRKSGKTYRLPSEAEWEFAARGGTATAYWQDEKIGMGQANFGATRDGTIPVGYFGANAFGLADVHGNVSELVADCWTPELGYLAADGRAMILSGDCGQRVVRGGGWDSSPANSRAASRIPVADTVASTSIGFRVVRWFDDDDRESRLRLR